MIGPCCVQVPGPLESATRLADPFLLLDLDQQPQRAFDHLALGPESGEPLGLTHQFVVDYDVGSHGWSRCVYGSYNLYTLMEGHQARISGGESAIQIAS